MMGTRPTVALVFLLSFLLFWSKDVDAASCSDCKTRMCNLHCQALAGKRSEVSSRDHLNELHQNKPSPGIEWTRNQRCTLDAWFQELPLDWQRHIIELFQLALAYTEPL